MNELLLSQSLIFLIIGIYVGFRLNDIVREIERRSEGKPRHTNITFEKEL